jgi:hypothetical protein
MPNTAVSDMSAEQQKVLDAIENELVGIRRGLDKEGAGLDVQVDTESATLVASLERHRIVCEGCLLPEHLVQTMLNKALNAKGLKYTVETRNWLLTEEALS